MLNRDNEGTLTRAPQPGIPTRESMTGNRGATQPGQEPREGGLETAAKQLPSISIPKGGGAIRGIDEKFSVNPATGTGSLSLPLPASPSRSNFNPQLALSYSSGAGNGPFGLGWDLSVPAITRKTDKGLPKYQDEIESDIFILSGAEDLVPVLKFEVGEWKKDFRIEGEYRIQRYRPRTEGLFARIEKWTKISGPPESIGDIHWRATTKDNITSIYGSDEHSRIADPEDPTHVFSWLLEESFDDKGNAIVYEYKQENGEGIDLTKPQEGKRLWAGNSFANQHLKRVKYGNRNPFARDDWLFEVVLDYGEHDGANPQPAESRPWPVRQDAFSTYRAGFEIRTYRLCQRVLMFHHFDELGAEPVPVRSLDLQYEEHPHLTYLISTTQKGYVKDGGAYHSKALPPLEFDYTRFPSEEEINDEPIVEVDAESLENLPVGIDEANYQWIDLDGEGLSGVLAQNGAAWYFKRNLGNARFAPIERLTSHAAHAALQSPRTQIMDIDGNGMKELVLLDDPITGFYEKNHENGWDEFVAFEHEPNVDWGDPNLRMIDLTGDGFADILISNDDSFLYFPSKADEGFEAPAFIRKATDEEEGPALVFADRSQSIFLADMSGGGLTDIVRIRNGEVCYWPNLGYGRFGAKIIMDTPPFFDYPDQFDPRRIRLADIDGSGTTDIIYLNASAVKMWLNQAGNDWSAPIELRNVPPVDNLAAVSVIDLLGNGTACLVWSSPLQRDASHPMRYIDLMAGQKPHLLITSRNNMGSETRLQHASSTKFYLQDRLDGKPWITRLPFPVHVVERIETYDHLSGNRFVTRYAYHHGYFDGIEREFRGFGMVEQWDTEEFAALSDSDDFSDATNLDEASHVPPVLSRTWFHTGAYFDGIRISRQFEDEYYRESDLSEGLPGLTDEQLRAMLLNDTVLPVGLSPEMSAEETREACRALKGSMLRQEIYAYDGTDEEDRPYSVSERNYTIKRLQPAGENKHAVFFAHSVEAIDFHYERKLFDIGGIKLADPRVTHGMTLAVDDFGNVLQSVAIGYGRRHPDDDLTPEDREKQTKTLITFTENHYTNPILEDDAYRAPLPCESRTYELLKVTPDSDLPEVTNLFRFGEMQSKVQEAGDGDHDLPYEDVTAAGAVEDHPYRRLIEHVRTLFRRDDLTGPLPLHQLQPLALPYESYKLAFTPGLLTQVYNGRVTDTMLADEGKYTHSEGDANWWIPSGQVFYSPDKTHTPAQELTFAQAHFFLPHRVLDPFGETAVVHYDNDNLLVIQTIDPLNNTIIAENDYRLLQPWRATDPNGNRAQVTFDTLGMVAGTAVMGKAGEDKGDSLDGFNADLTAEQINDFFNAGDPHDFAPALLGNTTSRIIYDLDRFRNTRDANPDDPTTWQPVFAATLARETHFHGPLPPGGLKIQISLSYSDGFGREIQKKIQAEPETPGGPPRWVGSGWTIFNNKGKPVRQYEPFFSPTHEFEFAKMVGVSPVLFYDPVERVIAMLLPNDTYEKVIFDPWRQETWDVNDTVLLDPRADADVRGFTKKYFDAVDDPPGTWQTWHAQRDGGEKGPQEQEAANKAAAHAGTSTVAHFDTLGRPFLTIADNGAAGKYETRVELDIEGNQRSVTDTRNLQVMAYGYDMLGTRIHQNSMDAGEKWTLNDVAGKPIRAWDTPPNPSHPGHSFRMEYDELRRPVRSFVKGAIAEEPTREILFERVVYGEQHPRATDLNLRARAFLQFDSAGMVKSGGVVNGQEEAFDFKGNLLRSSRRLANDYRNTPDWNSLEPLFLPSPLNLDDIENGVAALLESESFTGSTTYDALNRPISLTTPDNSVIHPFFNEANLLNVVNVNLRGADEETEFVANIDYNAKGQRELIEYGNGVQTTYDYDPLTFRLTHLKTTRDAEGDLQNLSYTYDPVGNITHIRDNAQQTIYFDNTVVEPSNEYIYDAIYRLIEATGREHLGQTDGVPNSPHRIDHDDSFFKSAHHPGDGNAMGRYRQEYEYDEVGNILAIRHRGTDPANPGWKRCYQYALDSNRLLSTGDPSDPHNPDSSCPTHYAASPVYAERYSYDAHGNMTSMPHLREMIWDFKDQLREVDLNGGGRAYYVYDASGQRVRKVHEHNGGLVEERIYLGGFEIYRKRVGGDLELERETLHIMDDKKRIALVDTRTQGHDDSPPQLTRYQFDNHLGSACLELNEFGAVISYEEYHPYGTTSYQAGPNAAEVSLKRYRYTGKERDEETGLYYHGARYYAPWLGRWCSADPAGLVDGSNLYSYVRLNPITRIDLKGFDSVTLGSDVSNEEIIGFFRQVDRNSYLQRVERFALATNYNIERVEGRTIRQVSTTKFSGHFRSLVSERNVQRVNTQLERISNLRAANTIPILFTFLAAFRESGPMAYDPREISDTYWGGGLDNLFNQQFDLRNRGVLPEDIDFKRGTDYGGSGDSGTHLSARVPADKKIIAYAARAGFASQRFIELATSRRYGYTMDDIHNLSRLQLNFWLALTFAAEGGEPTWNDYLERKESGERGGFGVQTLLAYLAERGLGLAEVTNLRGTFTQNGRSIQHHGHIRNNVRIRKAMILAANVTALEEEFEVWRNSERPLPSQENQCISVGYCP